VNVNELSRRLCVREHPHLHTTNQRVPCGDHAMAGQRLWHLATEAGTRQFEVIRDMRMETGLDRDPLDGYRGVVATLDEARERGMAVHVAIEARCEDYVERHTSKPVEVGA
jgi:hypothetical protein